LFGFGSGGESLTGGGAGSSVGVGGTGGGSLRSSSACLRHRENGSGLRVVELACWCQRDATRERLGAQILHHAHSWPVSRRSGDEESTRPPIGVTTGVGRRRH